MQECRDLLQQIKTLNSETNRTDRTWFQQQSLNLRIQPERNSRQDGGIQCPITGDITEQKFTKHLYIYQTLNELIPKPLLIASELNVFSQASQPLLGNSVILLINISYLLTCSSHYKMSHQNTDRQVVTMVTALSLPCLLLVFLCVRYRQILSSQQQVKDNFAFADPTVITQKCTDTECYFSFCCTITVDVLPSSSFYQTWQCSANKYILCTVFMIGGKIAFIQRSIKKWIYNRQGRIVTQTT